MNRGLVTGIDRAGRVVFATLDDGQEIEASYVGGEPPWPMAVALFDGGPAYTCLGAFGDQRVAVLDDFVTSSPKGSHVKVEVTTGNTAVSSTSYVKITGSDLSIPAQAGDSLVLDVSAQWGGAAGYGRLDAYTDSGSNYVSGNGAGGVGVRGWGGWVSSGHAVGCSWPYVVAAADVDSDGQVALHLRTKYLTTAKTLYGPLHFSATNIGRQ